MPLLVQTPSRSSIRDALVAWAREWTGMVAIWANQNATPPALPYVTLQIIAMPKLGHDIRGAVDEDTLAVTAHGQRELTLSVNALGAGATAALESLRSSLDHQAAIETLAAAGLASRGVPDLRDLTALIESKFQERAQMDVRFGFGAITVEDWTALGGYIQAVEMAQTVTTDGQDPKDESFTIGTPAEPEEP